MQWKALSGLCAIAALALAAGLAGTGCLFETVVQAPPLVFMGNSITESDTSTQFGWDHTGGMAASSREKDYVHRTLAILKENGREMTGVLGARDCDTASCDGPIEEHLNNMDQVRRLRPRYVVVQLGENSTELEVRSGKLRAQYRALLAALENSGVRRIFCVTPWKDTSLTAIRTLAVRQAMHGIPEAELVDITSVSADPANSGDPALYANPDVLWHPVDAGMEAIARALAGAILNAD